MQIGLSSTGELYLVNELVAEQAQIINIVKVLKNMNVKFEYDLEGERKYISIPLTKND